MDTSWRTDTKNVNGLLNSLRGSDSQIVRHWVVGNLLYVVRHGRDYDPDLSYLEQDYSDVSKKEQAEYKAADAKRLRAFNDGEWHMTFIGVEIYAITKSNWSKPPLVGRDYLHGIESDSGAEYFGEVEEQCKTQAEHDLKSLCEAICPTS